MDRIKESFDNLPIAACFFGPLGAAAAGVLCLLAGVWERYWVIYVAHPH